MFCNQIRSGMKTLTFRKLIAVNVCLLLLYLRLLFFFFVILNSVRPLFPGYLGGEIINCSILSSVLRLYYLFSGFFFFSLSYRRARWANGTRRRRRHRRRRNNPARRRHRQVLHTDASPSLTPPHPPIGAQIVPIIFYATV